jgi:hypothetical protein
LTHPSAALTVTVSETAPTASATESDVAVVDRTTTCCSAI